MKNKRSEMLIVSTLNETSICDISTGGYDNLYSACRESLTVKHFTEIENIIITHYHNYHAKSLLRICDKYMVRNVYLPLAENEEEQQLLTGIIETLKTTCANVRLYKRGVGIKGEKGAVISVSQAESVDRSTHPVFSVCVSNDTNSLTYASSAYFELDKKDTAIETDILIIGSHGPTVKSFSGRSFLTNRFAPIPHTIVFSSPYEMLGDDNVIDYVHYLYQNGHKIIIDGKNNYKFNLS
jgi:hypothetical protein